MKKLKVIEIILYIMLFSLFIVIYFLTLNSLSELINIPIKSLIEYSLPILTFSSILVSAIVAIFVMNSNHTKDLKMKKEEREIQNELNLMRSERILNDYIMISEGYANGIKNTYNIKTITIEVLLNEVRNIIDDCKKIRVYDYYEIKNRQVEIFELTDTLISISKNIEFLLVTEGLNVQPHVIAKKFNEIKILLEDFYKNSKYIALK